MFRVLSRLQIPVLLFVIVTGFYWRLVLTNQYTWLSGPDYSDQVLPWYQFEAGEWHAKRIPLWDPYEWGGQSIIGQGQPGVADPLNLPLFFWPLKRGWLTQGVLHWFYVLPHWLAAMGFYKLCRDFGRTRMSSVMAASLYTLGGIGGSLDWPQMMHATVWGPMAFLFQFRAVRGIAPLRNGILSGFFLGLAWLAGHHQIPLYFTLASFAFWLYFFSTRNESRFTIARSALAAGALMFLVSAVQTLPAYQYGLHAVRWVGADHALKWNEPVPYWVHQHFSMNPRSLLALVIPGFDTSYPPTLGLIVMLIALYGIVTTWDEPCTRWMTALAGFACVYSLGGHTVFQGILYALVPLVEKSRVPAIAQILCDVGLCALFAAGLDRLENEDWARWRARLANAFGVSGVLLIATGIVLTIMRLFSAGAEDRWMFTGWVGIACWILLRRNVRFTKAWLLLMALAEVGGMTTKQWTHNNDPDRSKRLDVHATHADIASYLRTRPGPPRMSYSNDDIAYTFGDWWGVEAVEAMVPSAPAELFESEVWSRQMRRLLGVRYYVGNKPAFDDLNHVYRSVSGLQIWEDVGAFPRIWTVHQASTVADVKSANTKLLDPATDLRHSTYLIGPSQPPHLENCEDPADGTRFTARAPNRLLIHAELSCTGMVIIPDLFDSGWKAFVDGSPATILQAYGVVRGVVAGPGSHTIEMIYRPLPLIAGAWLTALGLLLTFATVWKVRL